MKPFKGSIDDLLKRCSKISKKEIDAIDFEAEKNASISLIMREMDCSFDEAVDYYKQIALIETKKAINFLLEMGDVEVTGYNENGEPLYSITKKGRKKVK
jgi:hypothetical protein